MKNNEFELNGTIYGYKIEPNRLYINAEIYKLSKMFKDSDFEISLLDKEFGSMFRKPKDKDYADAKLWVENQIKNIKESNSIKIINTL